MLRNEPQAYRKLCMLFQLILTLNPFTEVQQGGKIASFVKEVNLGLEFN